MNRALLSVLRSTPSILSRCVRRAGRQCINTSLIAACVLLAGSTEPLRASEGLSAGGHVAGRYAISIGINNYTFTSKLPRLYHAVEDAQRLSQELGKLGYKTQPLYNFQTNPQNLLARILDIGRRMDRNGGRENGTLVITYAGHGFEQDDENFLAMGNADPDNLSGTSLSMTDLKNVLVNSRIGKVILLIDACRSNPARSSVDSKNVFVEQSNDASGISMLFSSSPGEPSYEYGSINQGVFSYFVANALKGEPEALDADGWITVSSLFEHVKEQIGRFNQLNDYPEQYPWRVSDNNGDLRIGKPISATLPALATDRPETTSNRFSLWKLIAAIAGVLALGALVSEAGSDGADDTADPAVTLLVPTP